MVTDAAANIHLRDQAARLLTFYANQRNSFRPALELIAKRTGLDAHDISKIRKRLIDRGLIAYEPGSYILVDWDRIRIFAALEKPLTLPRSKAYTFSPVRKTTSKAPTIGQTGRKYRIRNPRTLTATEKHFYSTVDQLTEAEFIDLMNLLPGEPILKPPYITICPENCNSTRKAAN